MNEIFYHINGMLIESTDSFPIGGSMGVLHNWQVVLALSSTPHGVDVAYGD